MKCVHDKGVHLKIETLNLMENQQQEIQAEVLPKSNTVFDYPKEIYSSNFAETWFRNKITGEIYSKSELKEYLLAVSTHSPSTCR